MLAEIGLQLSLERWHPRCQTCNGSASPHTLHSGDAVQILRHRELAGAIGIVQEVKNQSVVIKTVFRGQEHQSKHELDSVRSLSIVKELHRCSGCKLVHFCSRACQRQGWQAHRRFCAGAGGLAKGQIPVDSWITERQALQEIRGRLENPRARQTASAEELLTAFRRFQHFIDKWTQTGRLPHLVPGHYAVQEALLIAIPIGSLLLWKSATMASDVRKEVYERLVKMVSLHCQHVQMLVPRFHIAHWTALHYVLGILLAREFVEVPHTPLAASLVTLFESCLDVAEAFDAEAAESYKSLGQHQQGRSTTEGSRVFQSIASDPAKLATFYNIDPELPLEQKMAQMAQLLHSAGDNKESAGLPVQASPTPMQTLQHQRIQRPLEAHALPKSAEHTQRTCLDALD